MKILFSGGLHDFVIAICRIAPVIAMVFCSPNTIENDSSGPPIYGMHKIYAAGKVFAQGANDTQATLYERPCIKSKFTYDYWIDTTEVTQPEYFSVTGKRPVADTSAYGSGDRNPVYYVSWFDAILFCNDKSKMGKLDTVYSYFGAPKMQNGRAYDLAGLRINYDRNGYRLPTEAEWEFAAREGTSQIPFPMMKDTMEIQNYAWDAANSSGVTHPVATRKPNAFGLYDMAGNVYEWTNDWKGFYALSAVTNSIGTPQTINNNERVIKGGSFNGGAQNLRPSRRQAAYPTYPSAAVEYIGFRCVRGTIPNPMYITQDTASIATNSWSIVVTSARPFLGTDRAKLIFVNVTQALRTLCLVDFNQVFLQPYEFKDRQNVHAPVISPNGRWVAYCTSDDGAFGPASMYVRSLDSLTLPPCKLPSDTAFGPRWWVDPASRDTNIIYTSSAVDDQSAVWPSTRTFMCKIINGRSAGDPQVLISNGSYHDGRSKNGRYMVTGYTQLFMRDLTNNIDHRLFLSPFNGKDANGSSQVCNVSMSPDTVYNDRCMFLDFGCPPPAISTLTGTSYGIHEYIFMARFSGAVTASYKCPVNERAWDYPEWSTHPDFAVSCARNGAEESRAVYLIDLARAQYQKLIDGAELSDPFLWVQPERKINPDSLDLDSLGNYNDPHVSFNIGVLAYRMHGFWEKHASMETVFLGSSHTFYGIDPHYFAGTRVSNMSIFGGVFSVAYLLAVDYLLNHCPSLKVVACDYIPATMNWTDFFTPWTLIADNKGFNYDKNHGYWKTRLPNNFEELVALSPCPVVPQVDTLGLDRSSTCSGWGGPLSDPVGGGLTWSPDDPQYRINFAIIKDLAKKLYAKKIHFLMYITPESPYFKYTGSYGRYGPNRQTAHAIIAQVTALQDTFSGYFHFYDANRDGDHDYTDIEASDCEHLCAVGARKLSIRMDSVVNAILHH